MDNNPYYINGLPTLDMDGLQQCLLENHRCQPVTVCLRTYPKMIRGARSPAPPANPYWDNIAYLARWNCIIGADYESCVNRQRLREGVHDNFIAQELWSGAGEYVPGNIFIIRRTDDDPSLYLAIKQQKCLDNAFHRIDTMQVVPRNDIQPWMPNRPFPRNQGVQKPVRWRTPRLENLWYIGIGGESYTLDIEN